MRKFCSRIGKKNNNAVVVIGHDDRNLSKQQWQTSNRFLYKEQRNNYQREYTQVSNQKSKSQ